MSEETYKFFDGLRLRLQSGRELFSSRATGRACVVAREVLAAAAQCLEFAPLDKHARRIESLTGNHAAEQQVAACKRHLAAAVEGGLLLGSEHVRSLLAGHDGPPGEPRTITQIGIATKNRPRALKRLVSELTANLESYGRSAEILVMDDSDTAAGQAANIEVLLNQPASRSTQIRYGNLRTRDAFAKRLARACDVAEDVIRFAISPAAANVVSIGSCRNALLLQSFGRGILFIDDDVRCRFVAMPSSCRDVTFANEGAASQTHFFQDPDDIERLCHVVKDLVGLHEELLNVSIAALSNGLSSLGSRLLDRLANGCPRVAVSLMGVAGDSGLDHPLPYLCENASTFARLTASEDSYRAALKNRLVLRGPSQIVLTDRPSCMSYCMGVDNALILPPFMPLCRGEELVFASLVNRCLPSALFGSMPEAILHSPMERRTYEDDALFRHAGKPSSGETIACLISMEPSRGCSREIRLRSLGTRLRELAALERRAFEEHIRHTLRPLLLSLVARLDGAVPDGAQGPAPWSSDIPKVMAECVRSLNERDYSAPFDLECIWGHDRASEVFRGMLDEFGRLLHSWPTIVQQAAEFQSSGEHALCLPLSHAVSSVSA